MKKEKRINIILEKLGLYQTDWVGFEKVIKLKTNDYTIIIKKEGEWSWYNKELFDEICEGIESVDKLKVELLNLLQPNQESKEEVENNAKLHL